MDRPHNSHDPLLEYGLARDVGKRNSDGRLPGGSIAWLALWGSLCAIAQGFGAFDTADIGLLHGVPLIERRPRGSDAPLVVALDRKLIAAWGPPPWPLNQWRQLAAVLARQGQEEIFLVDEIERAVRCTSRLRSEGSAIEMARIWLAAAKEHSLRAGDSVACVTAKDSPFLQSNQRLGLPVDDRGRLLHLRSKGFASTAERTLFCGWVGLCPKEVTFGPVVEFPWQPVPTVSAADLLEGQIRIDEEVRRRAPALLGLTAEPFAQVLYVGPDAVSTPYPFAVAAAVASGRSHGATHPLSRTTQILMVALCLLSSVAAVERFRIPLVWIFLSAGSLWIAAAVGVYVTVGRAVPVCGALLVGAPVAVVSLWAERRRAEMFLRQLARLDRGYEFRFGAEGSVIEEEEELIRKLGWFSRSFFQCCRSGFFRYRTARRRFEFAGGYGVEPSDLLRPEFAASDPAFAAALESQPSGVLAWEVCDRGAAAQLVPVLAGTQVVGMWMLLVDDESKAPESRKLATVVAWLTLRLSAGGSGLRRTMLSDRCSTALPAVGIAKDMARTERLILEALEERKTQENLLYELPVPLMLADMSGAVVAVNRALATLLFDAGVGVTTTVRELLFRLVNERAALRAASSLFAAREAASLLWACPNGRSYSVDARPVYGDVKARPEELLGFVATFVDVTVAYELRSVHQHAVETWTGQALRRLQRLPGLLHEMSAARRSRMRALRRVRYELGVASTLLAKAHRALQDPEASLSENAPGNLPAIVEMALGRVRANNPNRRWCFDVHPCEQGRPVDLHAAGAIEQLTRILEQVQQTAICGERAHIYLDEHGHRSRLTISWRSFQVQRAYLDVANAAGPRDIEQELPPLLLTCVQAKEVFPGLTIRHVSTGQMQITIGLDVAEAGARAELNALA